MSLERPRPFIVKWGEKSLKEQKDKKLETVTLPPDRDANHSIGKADIETGFPEITMRSVLNGGVPPWGQDHNGILYLITKAIQYQQAGGSVNYDKEFCDAIGGYPKGAILQSTRYAYLFFVNMINGNNLNPDTYESPNNFWKNDNNICNGWSILTTLSENADNISFYTNDFKILTKVAGNKNELFVRPSFKDVLLEEENGNKPYPTVQDALNDVPDGGTATIYLYYPDGPYYTTLNNTPYVSKDNCFWNIGTKNITLKQYGNENFKTILQEIKDKHLPYNAYIYKDYERLSVYMLAYEEYGICNTSGIIGSGSLDISGIAFSIYGEKVNGNFNGAFISPHIQLTTNGCIFNDIGKYPSIWGGWGGNTVSIKINQCSFVGEGQFFWLSDDILSLTVIEAITKSSDYDREPFNSNSKDFLSKASHYLNFSLAPTGYTSSGKVSTYTPRGLNTYLTMIVDS